jgi:hypothetical protein
MGLLDEWGDALVEEGLKEAADTFFGARTALDEDIAYFESQADKLRLKAAEVRSWFAGLNCLLGSESSTRLFFDSLGVTLNDESLYSLQACSLQFRRPRSFTRKGLFAKTVWEVYEPLARLIEAYMHGTPYTDPLHPGRVMITVNYNLLLRQCERLNERINGVNESNRPSESLGFAKRMDQTQMLKESVTGGGGQTWTLDQDLAYALLDFEKYDLPAFPDLPLDSKARSILEESCARIFSQRRGHVDAILDEVFDPEDKTICVLDRGGQ